MRYSFETIHDYKGYEIEKKEKYYFQGSEKWYIIRGVYGSFDRLKDAKRYIDLYLTDLSKEAK
jgi:hypothetical protein